MVVTEALCERGLSGWEKIINNNEETKIEKKEHTGSYTLKKMYNLSMQKTVSFVGIKIPANSYLQGEW